MSLASVGPHTSVALFVSILFRCASERLICAYCFELDFISDAGLMPHIHGTDGKRKQKWRFCRRRGGEIMTNDTTDPGANHGRRPHPGFHRRWMAILHGPLFGMNYLFRFSDVGVYQHFFAGGEGQQQNHLSRRQNKLRATEPRHHRSKGLAS
jgi:hypothetical protein